jgi:hypothetical protein
MTPSIGLLLLVAFLGLGVDACLQTEGQRRGELQKRADEILPASAQVRSLGYGDCVELAPSPSCAKVIFELPERDSARRAALVRDTAVGHGWIVTHTDDAEGGWSVWLKRDGFTAVVFLWRPEVYDADCGGEPDPGSNTYCFNTLNLTR